MTVGNHIKVNGVKNLHFSGKENHQTIKNSLFLCLKNT